MTEQTAPTSFEEALERDSANSPLKGNNLIAGNAFKVGVKETVDQIGQMVKMAGQGAPIFLLKILSIQMVMNFKALYDMYEATLLQLQERGDEAQLPSAEELNATADPLNPDNLTDKKSELESLLRELMGGGSPEPGSPADLMDQAMRGESSETYLDKALDSYKDADDADDEEETAKAKESDAGFSGF